MEARSLVRELVRGDAPVLGGQQDPLLRVAGQVLRAEQADARGVEPGHLGPLLGGAHVLEAVQAHRAARWYSRNRWYSRKEYRSGPCAPASSSLVASSNPASQSPGMDRSPATWPCTRVRYTRSARGSASR